MAPPGKRISESTGKRREKQVRVSVFSNEPMARLAEQLLRQEGIPCLTRSLQGGPGLWGSAYNLPHGLYVYESDEMRAREALDLAPLEVEERELSASTGGEGDSLWARVKAWWLLFVVLAVLLGWIFLFDVFRLLV